MQCALQGKERRAGAVLKRPKSLAREGSERANEALTKQLPGEVFAEKKLEMKKNPIFVNW